ncbi:MAG: hypothetical protein U1E21_21690 [Reyranellaceae bacterium]
MARPAILAISKVISFALRRTVFAVRAPTGSAYASIDAALEPDRPVPLR